MNRPSIPRSTYVAAIEAGIKSAKLVGQPADKLRVLAQSAKLIGVGNFKILSGGATRAICHCPLSTVGLADPETGDAKGGVTQDQVGAFARVFDADIFEALPDHYGDDCDGTAVKIV